MRRLLLHPLGISVVTALAGTAAAYAIRAFDAPRWLYLPLVVTAFVAGVVHSRWERRQTQTPEPEPRPRPSTRGPRYLDLMTVHRSEEV